MSAKRERSGGASPVGVSLLPEDRAVLDALALREGVSRSEVVRRLIRAHVVGGVEVRVNGVRYVRARERRS